MNKKPTDKQKRSREKNLKPFQPGQSGNPKGRPAKKDCLTSLLKEEIEKVCPDDKSKKTWKELIIIATMKLAIQGNSTALIEVWQRMDGKVTQPIGGDEDSPLKIIYEPTGKRNKGKGH